MVVRKGRLPEEVSLELHLGRSEGAGQTDMVRQNSERGEGGHSIRREPQGQRHNP